MSINNWATGCLGKKKYPTKELADKVARKVKRERDVKLRSYMCPHCLLHHLTSKPYKGSKGSNATKHSCQENDSQRGS